MRTTLGASRKVLRLGTLWGQRGGKGREAWNEPRPAAVSDFPECSALRKVPAPTTASPPVSGMEDAEPGWPTPCFPPGFSNPRRGGLGSLLKGSAALEAPPTDRGRPWMSPKNFPERTGKSCLLSNHFPSHKALCLSSDLFFLSPATSLISGRRENQRGPGPRFPFRSGQ